MIAHKYKSKRERITFEGKGQEVFLIHHTLPKMVIKDSTSSLQWLESISPFTKTL